MHARSSNMLGQSLLLNARSQVNWNQSTCRCSFVFTARVEPELKIRIDIEVKPSWLSKLEDHFTCHLTMRGRFGSIKIFPNSSKEEHSTYRLSLPPRASTR